MIKFEDAFSFQNLYKAHRVARLGKQKNREVIEFEMNLGSNICKLQEKLLSGEYDISGYYDFMVHDPKDRVIHALHYSDRVVQHCLCDEIIASVLDKKLIYDNAACRIGKGTHFALDRTTRFLREFYRKHGCDGYFLKCDISKFFDSIDHCVLWKKLQKQFDDERFLGLLGRIISSYAKSPGKGLPLGNQTSLWFAIFYLDEFDRFIKEKLKIRYYSRYMDDCVLIHSNKEYLKYCLAEMTKLIEDRLKLSFNSKTQIFPIRAGVDYLGFHIYLSDNVRVIRRLRRQSKKKFIRSLKTIQIAYSKGEIDLCDVQQVLSSYLAHMAHGDTYRLKKKYLETLTLVRYNGCLMK